MSVTGQSLSESTWQPRDKACAEKQKQHSLYAVQVGFPDKKTPTAIHSLKRWEV